MKNAGFSILHKILAYKVGEKRVQQLSSVFNWKPIALLLINLWSSLLSYGQNNELSINNY